MLSSRLWQPSKQTNETINNKGSLRSRKVSSRVETPPSNTPKRRWNSSTSTKSKQTTTSNDIRISRQSPAFLNKKFTESTIHNNVSASPKVISKNSSSSDINTLCMRKPQAFSSSSKKRISSIGSNISRSSTIMSLNEMPIKSNLYEPLQNAHEHHTSKSHNALLTEKYEALLASRNMSDKEMRESQKKLRKLILTEGLPVESLNSTLRGRVWKILLGIYRISAQEYINLTERGSTEVYEKIKNDTFRTMATDKSFGNKVSESMLTRVLNAFVWKVKDRPTSRLMNLTYSYVQGMNVLAAPFLFVLPEVDAFFTFTSFIQQDCPLYVQPSLEGVHCGLKLMDKCLEVVEVQLYKYLNSKKLSATVYAFPSVMTFCACTQPLSELTKLWDFLLAYGIHLNILCVISQIILIKNELINSPSPMKQLRTLPDLDAAKIINITLGLIPLLPEDLYDLLVRHPFDPMIYDDIDLYCSPI